MFRIVATNNQLHIPNIVGELVDFTPILIAILALYEMDFTPFKIVLSNH